MLRRSSTGFCLRMSVPSTSMVPELGSMRRLIIFMVVVLPQPEGPMRTTVSPLFMSRERSPTAAGPPFWLNVLDTFLSEIATSDIRSPYVYVCVGAGFWCAPAEDAACLLGGRLVDVA